MTVCSFLAAGWGLAGEVCLARPARSVRLQQPAELGKSSRRGDSSSRSSRSSRSSSFFDGDAGLRCLCYVYEGTLSGCRKEMEAPRAVVEDGRKNARDMVREVKRSRLSVGWIQEKASESGRVRGVKTRRFLLRFSWRTFPDLDVGWIWIWNWNWNCNWELELAGSWGQCASRDGRC